MTEQAAPDMGEILSGVRDRIAGLANALEEKNPGIENYLSAINMDVRQYPELMHMLSEEEIAAIYKGLQTKTGIHVTVKTAKKKGNQSKLDDGSSVADLL